MEEVQPYWQGQPSLPRSRVSVKFFVKICFCLYERRASPPWRDLAIDYPRSRLGGLEIFHINALKRASKSKLRTHDRVCLDQHFLDNVSFHKLCLFMCRIENANIAFRVSWEPNNTFNPGDSAKRVSPGQQPGQEGRGLAFPM